MFGIGFGEMLIIAVVLLLAVGPRQLPALMKSVGKGMRELRRASDDLRRSTGIDELFDDDALDSPLKPEASRHGLRKANRERKANHEGVEAVASRATFEASPRAAQDAEHNPLGEGV
jgi:Tat protein translocase TatB subunit